VILDQFKELELKYKSSVIFGAAGLFLSVFTGLISGNSFSQLFIKSMIMSVSFLILGYGIIFIIQKFVPEMYEMLNSINSSVEIEGGVEVVKESAAEENTVAADITQKDTGNEEIGDEEAAGVSEPAAGESVDKPDFVPVSEENITELTSNSGASGEKMGKHIIEEEKMAKYEPQIMAEAIRTMLKRDEES